MRRRQRSGVRAVAIAASVGFVAGAVVVAMIRWGGPAPRAAASARTNDDCGQATYEARPSAVATHDEPAPVRGSSAPATPVVIPLVTADPIADLRDRRLLLPVAGVDRSDISGSFAQERGAGRLHEAIDILAPRHTHVLAVEDGTIAKLFYSKAGGSTIYHFDPSSTYAYYYAHLERYAGGLKEGDRVRRGQLLGYVGTSGNAPPDTPHLHFAIFRLTDKKQWWQGTPIDPYDALR